MSAYNNTITLVGRLGGDPLIEDTAAGTVCNFSMAVNIRKKEGNETDWFRIEAWHDVARGVKINLAKGDRVIVLGSLRVQKADNGKIYHKVIAYQVGYLLSSKKESKEK